MYATAVRPVVVVVVVVSLVVVVDQIDIINGFWSSVVDA